MKPLSNTAVVILGMLSGGPKSGYDVKRLVDHSTRFFWSASYGQIYPELRALEAGGLVRGEQRATGGRERIVYELTPSGEGALRAWLTSDRELRHEIRDEGILKLFFSDALDRDGQLANLTAMRERYEALAARLRDEVKPLAGKGELGRFPPLTAGFGIELYEWLAEWCRRTESELRARPDDSGGS